MPRLTCDRSSQKLKTRAGGKWKQHTQKGSKVAIFLLCSQTSWPWTGRLFGSSPWWGDCPPWSRRVGPGHHPFPKRCQDTWSPCASAPRGLPSLLPASLCSFPVRIKSAPVTLLVRISTLHESPGPAALAGRPGSEVWIKTIHDADCLSQGMLRPTEEVAVLCH